MPLYVVDNNVAQVVLMLKLRIVFRVQLLPLFFRQQRRNHVVQFPFHNPVQLVDRKADPVIGHAVLRIVVCPDLFRTVARSDFCPPDCAFFFLFLTIEFFKDPRAD